MRGNLLSYFVENMTQLGSRGGHGVHSNKRHHEFLKVRFCQHLVKSDVAGLFREIPAGDLKSFCLGTSSVTRSSALSLPDKKGLIFSSRLSKLPAERARINH